MQKYLMINLQNLILYDYKLLRNNTVTLYIETIA